MSTEEYKGYSIEIVPDEDAQSPREWDNVGKMVCWHGRRSLGDEQPKESPSEYIEALARAVVDLADGVTNRVLEEVLSTHYIVLPLYIYDHSGITINTTGFSCPWDSGQVGFIYAKKGTEGLSDKQIEKHLQNEVKTYDTYISDEIVGFVVKKDDEEIDSCWGYYLNENAIIEAKRVIDLDIKTTKTELKKKRIIPVCVKCGSPRVKGDAYTEWDCEKQDWVLDQLFSNYVCDNCGKECNIEWEDVDE